MSYSSLLRLPAAGCSVDCRVACYFTDCVLRLWMMPLKIAFGVLLLLLMVDALKELLCPVKLSLQLPLNRYSGHLTHLLKRAFCRFDLSVL